MDLFIVRNQYEALYLGSHFDINPPYIKNQSEINSIFEFPRYMKGKNQLINNMYITHVCQGKYN